MSGQDRGAWCRLCKAGDAGWLARWLAGWLAPVFVSPHLGLGICLVIWQKINSTLSRRFGWIPLTACLCKCYEMGLIDVENIY